MLAPHTTTGQRGIINNIHYCDLETIIRGIHQESIHQVHLPFIQLHFLPDAARHGESANRVPDRCVNTNSRTEHIEISFQSRSWPISWRMTTSTTWCGSGRGRRGAPYPPILRLSLSSGRSGLRSTRERSL